jgi:uncharacterized protein YndB with AHSA1/START domain
MAGKSPNPETTLQIKRTFNSPREKVFKAWTDPQELRQWFAPTDDYSTSHVEVDLRVGGTYRIQMKAPDGKVYTIIGTYREVIVPEKLVFTWTWEGGASCSTTGEETETLVTVLFHSRGTGTEVVVTHEYLPTTEDKDKHSQGWIGCLNRLEKVL